MKPDQRTRILFGTDERVEPMRELAAGPLSVKLDRGNLRYVRWHGIEVLRGIAFVLRDASWGTYAPAIGGLKIAEAADAFEITYEASCDGPDGDFAYSARIAGEAGGTLAFHARGVSPRSFLTCRTGFVVLHPLDGVAGRRVEVAHASGGVSVSKFPELVSPDQPILDIRELSHSPHEGWTVRVRMEGDAYEMEDHRNWTDASFKTYVRPLSRGYPYMISAGEEVKQSVAVAISGPPPAWATTSRDTVVRIGGPASRLPRLGLFVEPEGVSAGMAVAAQLRELGVAFLTGRVDLRFKDAAAQLFALRDLAVAIGSPLALQIVIPAISPECELDPLIDLVNYAGALDSIHVAPARDLKSRLGLRTPQDEAEPEAILAAARRAFPDVRMAGGTMVPFAELNRNWPPAGIDLLVHATQANVHAADDISVMETIEALPHVIRSGQAFAGATPYRLGPSTIGTSRFTAPGHVAPNLHRGRVTMAADDPRQRALFGAAFALGLVAVSTTERVEGLTFASAAGAAGILDADGCPTPAAVLFRSLTGLADAETLHIDIEHGPKISAVALKSELGRHLFLANRNDVRQCVAVPGFRCDAIGLMDAETSSRSGSCWAAHSNTTVPGGTLQLDAYAVAMLDELS